MKRGIVFVVSCLVVILFISGCQYSNNPGDNSKNIINVESSVTSPGSSGDVRTICTIGNVNEDDSPHDILDVVALVQGILNTNWPDNCMCSTDVQLDGVSDILDVVSLVQCILNSKCKYFGVQCCPDGETCPDWLGQAKCMDCAGSTTMNALCTEDQCSACRDWDGDGVCDGGGNSPAGDCDYNGDGFVDTSDCSLILQSGGLLMDEVNPRLLRIPKQKIPENTRTLVTASILGFDESAGTFGIYMTSTSYTSGWTLKFAGVYLTGIDVDNSPAIKDYDWQVQLASSNLWAGKMISGASPKFAGDQIQGHFVTVKFATDGDNAYVPGTVVNFLQGEGLSTIFVAGANIAAEEIVWNGYTPEVVIQPTYADFEGTMGNADARDTIVTSTCCDGGAQNSGPCANDPDCGCDGSLDDLDPNPNYDETLTPSCNGGPIGDSGAASTIIVNFGGFGCGVDQVFDSIIECPMLPFLDVNGDGVYDMLDSQCIYSYSLGLLMDTAPCTPNSGVCAGKAPGTVCEYQVCIENCG